MAQTRLTGPLKIGPVGSEVEVVDEDGALNVAGVAITSTAAELNKLDGVNSSTTELDEYVLNVDMTDISTAASVWVVAPWAGTIEKIYSVINGAITVADAAITVELGGTAVTGAGITIAYTGSAAGTVDTSTPTALNIVTAGQAIEVITDGGSTDTARATFTLLMKRS